MLIIMKQRWSQKHDEMMQTFMKHSKISSVYSGGHVRNNVFIKSRNLEYLLSQTGK